MSTPKDASKPSPDSTAKPRLSLRRDKVKSLRVASGVQTGGCSDNTYGGKGCGGSGVPVVCFTTNVTVCVTG